jgi:hypothetical protein
MQSYRNDQSDRPESFLRPASRWQTAHFDFSFDQLAFAASHSLRVQFETARTAPERLTDGVAPRCECAGCWANAAVAASIIRIVEKIEARNRFIHRVIGCSPAAVATPALSSLPVSRVRIIELPLPGEDSPQVSELVAENEAAVPQVA